MVALSETEKRLQALERRLAQLEAHLIPTSKPSLLDDLMPGPPPTAPLPPTPSIPRRATSPSVPGARTTKPAPTLPKTLSGSATASGPGASELLAGVAVLCFILAGAWLLKLAVDSGWLDPARRVVLTALSGFGLIGAGVALRRSDREYASFLPAAGIVLLYLAAYAGHLMYELYPAASALGLVTAVTALAMGLHFGFNQVVYPLIAQFGAYMVPMLLPALRGNPVLVGFYLAWDVLFTALALYTKQRQLLPLAGYLALGTYSVSFELSGRVAPLDTAVFQAAQMAVFLMGSLAFTLVHRSPMRSNEAWSIFPLLLFFYGLEYALLQQLSPGLGPWMGLGWAALLVGAYAVVRADLKQTGLEAGPMVSAYAAVIVFHAAYLVLMPNPWGPWVALGVVPVLAWLLGSDFGKRHWGIPAAAGLIVYIEFWHVLLHWGSALTAAAVVLAGLLFAAAFLAVGLQMAMSQAQGKAQLNLPALFCFASAHLQAMAALARGAQLVSGATVAPPLLSVIWAVYGLCLMGLAWGLRRVALAQSALILLLVVAGKALFLDSSGVAPLVRIASFAALGGLLYVAGLLYRYVQTWED